MAGCVISKLCCTGWTGSDCTSVDACFSSPCQNAAQCHNERDTYVCSCPPRFTGRQRNLPNVNNELFLEYNNISFSVYYYFAPDADASTRPRLWSASSNRFTVGDKGKKSSQVK